MIITALSAEEIADIFDNAADHIAVYGWWKKGMLNCHPLAEDFWSAICRHRPPIYGMHQQLSTIVLRHFGLSAEGCTVLDIFTLNDSQQRLRGKEWAVGNLREIAAKVRGGAL